MSFNQHPSITHLESLHRGHLWMFRVQIINVQTYTLVCLQWHIRLLKRSLIGWHRINSRVSPWTSLVYCCKWVKDPKLAGDRVNESLLPSWWWLVWKFSQCRRSCDPHVTEPAPLQLKQLYRWHHAVFMGAICGPEEHIGCSFPHTYEARCNDVIA